MEVTEWIAAVAAVAWAVAAARAGGERSSSPHRRRNAGGRRFDSLVLHRLLHHEPDGSWTWQVSGVKVLAARTTDVSLLIEPDAAAHYCPDCLRGAMLWEATAADAPRALECRACRSLFALAYLIDEEKLCRDRRPSQ